MNAKKISIYEYNESDILASDIVNNQGVLIAVKYTQMNSYLKNKLVEHKISDLYILDGQISLDEIVDDNEETITQYRDYYNCIMIMKETLLNIATGNGLDIKSINTITKIVRGKLDITSNVIKCMKMIEKTDEYTYTHCINTAFYAMLIGKWLKLPENEIQKVIQAGLLHDIGKVKIPGYIINKSGILTKDEYEIIKQHTILGYAYLQDIEDLISDVKRAVLLHHERVDRSGYPLSVSSECVGVLAKIISVADVYDAMTSNRVYKKGVTPFDAFEMFKTIGVGLFDTTIMNSFLNNIYTYYVGMKVSLSNGDIGRIVYIPPNDIVNPVVLSASGYKDLSCEKELKIVSIL